MRRGITRIGSPLSAILLAAASAACSSSPPTPDCASDPEVCRSTCAYGAGDPAALTLADFPVGKNIPIDHFVMVMQENRTFDSYFSSLTVPGQTVDGASPTSTNPDPTTPGGTISRFHQTAYCFDNPAESWDDVHREIDNGALDAFTTQNALSDPTNDPTGARAMGYYDGTDLPYYYALAQSFAISDRHFSSAQANTWTNRVFYMAGTAFGITSNVVPPETDADNNPLPNLFTRLNDAGITWAFYVQDRPSLAILSLTWARNLDHMLPYARFFTDAAAGMLPSVVFVEGSDELGGVSPDEDPPADMQVGQAMVASIVAAVTTSPQWPSTAMLFSYDEQGGLYDHVVPPPACVPDDYAPKIDAGGVVAGYDHYGLRVPLIAISPYAKRGYVSHAVTDHTSLLRMIEDRFELPALTHRDANAVPPFDLFDFSHADLSVPTLPTADVDPTQQAACGSAHPPDSGEL